MQPPPPDASVRVLPAWRQTGSFQKEEKGTIISFPSFEKEGWRRVALTGWLAYEYSETMYLLQQIVISPVFIESKF